MRGVPVSRCCDGRRKRNRKSISWCHRSDFLAGVGVVQTDPPRSPWDPAVHPLRVPGGPFKGHKGHLAASRAASLGTGEVTQEEASYQ